VPPVVWIKAFSQAGSSVIFRFFEQFGFGGGLRRWISRYGAAAGVLVCLLVGLSGCSRFRPKPPAEYVYVTAKETFLRDRVAAVSNRTAQVENGDKLKILEHGRRFLRVETDKGEQGWIDEKVVATQTVFNQFSTLADEHKGDPAVATGVVRDDVYLHVAPGRDADRFYRLAEGDKLKLLKRATLLKPIPSWRRAVPTTAAGGKDDAPAPPAMEDWWLVRDAKGQTGWMLSRMMDVDGPDTLMRYAEGQRIVGAYVLTTVNDPDAPEDDKNIHEYVAVLSPYKAGLPYDFDQVRVFIWNIKKHRYETAFRQKNIEGYLPVEVKMAADPYGKAPTFSFRVLSDEAGPVVPDPTTGAIVPGKTVTKTYRLEGNLVRRILAPGTQALGEAHPAPEEKKAAKGRRRR
jgi:uncharacterized protein YgiM (DUF1202 family)